MIEKVEETRPRFLIISSRFNPFTSGPMQNIPIFRWARNTAAREYTSIGIVDIRRDIPSRYQWEENVKLTRGMRDWLMIYERKPEYRLP
jgi:hypothetical protein